MTASGDFRPFVSVVIRSKDRLDVLPELLERVREQRYEPFEVVVIDSSVSGTPEQWARVDAASGPNVRIVRSPPRGCPAAANEGLRQARGEILVYIDDDDLPIGRDWLWLHVRNFRDPACLGVNGFNVYAADHLASPLSRVGWIRRRLLLSHGPFKDPWGLVYDDRRKTGIDYLMGGNASIRRSAALLGGGWDEFLDYHDEHSLFLRLHKRKPPGSYLVYDPDPRMQIRKDIPGGLDARFSGETCRRVDTLARYFVRVVGREHPARIYGLAPAFVPYFVALGAIAGYQLSERRPVSRFAETLRGAIHAPIALAREMAARSA